MLASMIIASVVASQVQAASVVAGMGLEAMTSHPYVYEAGVRGSAEVELHPLFRLGGAVSFYPDLGEATLRPLGDHLVNSSHAVVAVAHRSWQAHGLLRFLPLTTSTKSVEMRSGAHAGAGVIRTVDDLDLLQLADDTAAQATQVQLHPTLVLGVGAEVDVGVVTLRGRAEMIAYTETFASTQTQNRPELFVGVDALFRVGGGS